jgi:archaemetzincin
MKRLQLLPVGDVDGLMLRGLKDALPKCFRGDCEILPMTLDPEPSFHEERRQYHSSELLRRMQPLVTECCERLLGVTAVDLYIPILTFVFGEAQMNGPCAVVSLHRLRQEFYGLPADREMLSQRLVKEAIHELGHTFHLTHCGDYRCVMSASHAVEWIDFKERSLCAMCQSRLPEEVRTARGSEAPCPDPER